MPKVRRKYYRRAQEVTNLVINTVQNKNLMPLLRNTPLISSNNLENNNDLSYQDCNDFQHINNDYNNLEDTSNYNSDSDPDDYIEHVNFVNNFESTNSTDDSPNSISWLQEWAIKNNITHIALNELISNIKAKYPELPRNARSLLGNPRKINVDVVAPGHYYHFGLGNCIKTLLT